MKMIFNKSHRIVFFSGILLICAGVCITFLIDNRRVEIVEVTEVESNIAQTIIQHYGYPEQAPRVWNREIYFEDMDSITISRWNSLSPKERVEAIKCSFTFDTNADWNSYTYEEQERMLLDNAFIEWK